MDLKIVIAVIFLLMASSSAFGESSAKKYSPGQYLKNHAFCACITDGIKPDEAAKYSAAAAREYLEYGSLPLEAHTEAVLLGRTFLAKEYGNIYGDNLVFMKCIDFYNSKELDQLAKKYMRKKSKK